MNFNFPFKNLNKNLKFENLKNHWFLLISAASFLLLNGKASAAYFVGMIISLLLLIFFAEKNIFFLENINKANILLKIFSALTAVGICLYNSDYLYRHSLVSSTILDLCNRLGIDVPKIIYYSAPVFAVLALPFVYVGLIFFWQWFTNIIKNISIFDDLDKKELITYLILFFTACFFMTLVFIKTDAFYTLYYNVIYTSDSPMINGSFFMLNGGFIHPLKSLFIAPFAGLPYFIAKILGMPNHIQALMINYSQIIMLFTAAYLLSGIMNLSPRKRVIFFIISCCSYMYLLSILMMEGYISYFFWLMLLLYTICKKSKFAPDVFIAGCGTILSSIILVLFLSEHSPLKNIKEWLKDIFYIIFRFFILMLSFGGFYIFYDLYRQIIAVTQYTGQNILFLDRFKQYTYFIYDCFFAPLTRININTVERTFWATHSWQLQFFENVSCIGIIIFILCMISAFINWEKKSSRFAFLWVIFSFFVLCIVGWGTAENGLILYSLYFGWAFFVLMFQLVEKIEEKLNVKFLLPLYLAVNIYILFSVNIPEMEKLIDFAIKYYPVLN